VTPDELLSSGVFIWLVLGLALNLPAHSFVCDDWLMTPVQIKKGTRHSAVEDEVQKLQGTWQQIDCEANGVKNPPEDYGTQPISIFTRDTFVVTRVDGSVVIKGTFRLDPTQQPKAIDWTDSYGADAGKTFPAIYTLDERHFIFCASDDGQPRPTEFRTRNGQVLRILRRITE
jgi:uncharacterized protein (TIGR03067 family)